MQFTFIDYTDKPYNEVILGNNPIKILVINIIINYFERLGGTTPNNDAQTWHFPKCINSATISTIIRNTCYKCGGLMKASTAFKQGKCFVDSYDSAIDTYQGTIEYPDNAGTKQVKVRKCSQCGHSHT